MDLGQESIATLDTRPNYKYTKGLRIVEGQALDLPIHWNYYLIADQHGRQMVLVFTMEGGLVEQFGDAGQALVRNIDFLGEPADAGAGATPATAKKPSATSVKR